MSEDQIRRELGSVRDEVHDLAVTIARHDAEDQGRHAQTIDRLDAIARRLDEDRAVAAASISAATATAATTTTELRELRAEVAARRQVGWLGSLTRTEAASLVAIITAIGGAVATAVAAFQGVPVPPVPPLPAPFAEAAPALEVP